MIDNRNYFIIKGEMVKVGQVIEVSEGFFESQCKTKSGKYKLEKINLSDIDVVFKNIANREFFTWEDGTHLDNIKRNFLKTPPVILEKYNSKYYSVDGHHRITVANELNLKNILAFVINVDKLSYPRN